MAVPLGTFVCGYIAIIIIFTGFYGALNQIAPGAFKGFSDDANFLEILYFSIVTATTVGYGDISPASGAARCLVGLQAILCLGWVVVVFVALTAHENKAKNSSQD
jgi:voltage-gated potassium channel